jgi:hypothetical protein
MRENIATVPAIPRRTLITLTMIVGIVLISTLPALRSSDASQRIFSPSAPLYVDDEADQLDPAETLYFVSVPFS